MEKWTTQQIPDLTGKIYLVTGANSGVGYETTLALAQKNANVVMACRNQGRGQAALDAIKTDVPNADLDLMTLDLDSLDSVRKFAEAYKSKYDRLDGLINNAGLVGSVRTETVEGFEAHFGAGHLGHFALTGLLLDVLEKTPSSRVVTVGSRMHAQGEMNWDDLNSETSYDRWKAYSQSKLANMLFAMELHRRLSAKGSGTISVSAHPGQCQTNWVANNMNGIMTLIGKLLNNGYQSAAIGALSILYAAVDADVKPGDYYGPENDTKGYPMETPPAEAALDEADAQRLWELSQDMTGVKYLS